MIKADADGIISTVAWRLMIVNLTVTFMPFQSIVAFWMSSPTFLGERPRGPILGASDDALPTSPPTALMMTYLGGSFDGGGPMIYLVVVDRTHEASRTTTIVLGAAEWL